MVYRYLLVLGLLFFSVQTYAYIGPGMGLGTIGVVLGIVGSILLALFAVLWYPFKRMLKKRAGNPADAALKSEADAADKES